MNKFLTTLLIGFSLISFPGWAADFHKGLAAADSGDFATALRQWTQLAEQGDAAAQYNLGLMYDLGKGIPQDFKIAAKWYTLAAEQGVAEAQFNLGVMYKNGEGVPQDYRTAVKWYTLAAEQGDIDAQSSLGFMYGTGQGVIQDDVYAHMWWNIAASDGQKDAVENRDIVTKKMTPSQIEKAQDLARECVVKDYKDC